MSEFMRVFEAKALAEALTDAGHSTSERTAQRWKKGETRPKPQDVRAIRELVGAMLPDTTKEPPPEWARAVAVETADEVIARLIPPDLLGAAHRLLAGLAELQPPSDEAPAGLPGAQDQAE
jgi:hypothetical protein